MVRAQIALRANNGDMLRDAAIAGLGIAMMPMFIVGAAIEVGELHVVDVGARPDDEFVYMAHPEGRRPSAKLRALAAHLRAAFGDPPYWDR
jgi:DNA-binding transcriptional LysR family regulator